MDLICKHIQRRYNRIVFSDLCGLLGGAVLYLAMKSVTSHSSTVVCCLVGNVCQAE